MNKKNLLYM